MPRRQPVPRLWLMTDERVSDARLLAAAGRLPRGSGIVFRHHHTAPGPRRALFEAVRRIARARRLLLVLAGSPRLARGWRADGSHGRSPHRSDRLRTAPAHEATELRTAERAGKQLVFLSPIHATRSHPGGHGLGRVRFGLLAGRTRLPVIALGGMTRSRFEPLRPLGAYGWAAIDALS